MSGAPYYLLAIENSVARAMSRMALTREDLQMQWTFRIVKPKPQSFRAEWEAGHGP